MLPLARNSHRTRSALTVRPNAFRNPSCRISHAEANAATNAGVSYSHYQSGISSSKQTYCHRPHTTVSLAQVMNLLFAAGKMLTKWQSRWTVRRLTSQA